MMGPTGVLQVADVDGSGDTFRIGPIRKGGEFSVQSLGFDFDLSADGQRLLVASVLEEEGQGAKMDPLTLVLGWTADLARP